MGVQNTQSGGDSKREITLFQRLAAIA